MYGGAVAGVLLVVAAVTADDPPLWWWLAGVPMAVLCGSLASIWILFRLRHRAPGERERALAALRQHQAEVGKPVVRSKVAYRATRHKRAVLRSGVDGSAVVTFLADGGRANEFRQLVYLELDVTVPGRQPYPVKTGEFINNASAGSVSPGRELQVKVDPTDPQRVAVDWEASLRLR